MGFLDALSAAVTPALQYRTGQLQGAEQKRQADQKDFLAALKLAQDQQEAAMRQQLQQAQIKNYESEAAARNAPKPPESFTLGKDQVRFGSDGQPIAQGLRTPTSNYEERQEQGGTAIYEDGHFKTWKVPPPGIRNAGMPEQRAFQREQGLQQAYQQNPTVKDAYGVANAVAGIKAAATGTTPQNDLAMIYSLVKFLDPNSAVREGEIDLARAARSLGTQVTGAWKKAASGNLLTAQERQNILGLLDQRIANAQSRLQPIQSSFGRRARQFGADSAYVAPDPFEGVSGKAPPPGFVPNPRNRP